jgi:hypothetical protein
LSASSDALRPSASVSPLFVAAIARWDVGRVSARIVDVPGEGPVSGPRRRAIVDPLRRTRRFARPRRPRRRRRALENAVDAELAREARAFDKVASMPGREKPLLILAAALTSQRRRRGSGTLRRRRRSGIAEGSRRVRAPRPRASRALRRRVRARRRSFTERSFRRKATATTPFARSASSARIRASSSRSVRSSTPGGPASRRGARFTADQRAEVLTGLVEGCRKVKGQIGYDRAIAGFAEAHRAG